MTGEEDEDSWEVLAEYRMGREGLHVKLDRGFEEGTYCVYVEYDDLVSRIGFAAANRRAGGYCGALKAQVERFAGHTLGKTEDASRRSAPGRRRDLELNYLTFPAVTEDGRFHDYAMQEQFQLAVLRANQQWDQTQARTNAQKQDSRRDAFRLQLDALLTHGVYRHLDQPIKDRLLEEVPALAFPPRGIER